MSTAPVNPAPHEMLHQEILDDARRQAERLTRRASQEAREIARQAGEESARQREAILAQARREAERRTALLLAKLPVEKTRMRAGAIEALLDEIRGEAARRLQDKAHPPLERGNLLDLVSGPVAVMEGAEFVLRLNPAGRRTLGDDFIEEARRRSGKSALQISFGEPLAEDDPGPLLQDAAGRQIWDNRLAARLERLWPQLRRTIAAAAGEEAAGASGTAGTTGTPGTAGTAGTAGSSAASGSAGSSGSSGRAAAARVTRVAGPIITASGMAAAQMFEVVRIGEGGLIGEVVKLNGDFATIQVYEDTTLLAPGAPVELTGAPLSVQLGPGLIGSIYDGIQRPLPGIQAQSGAWIRRGEKVPPLDLDRRWNFVPAAAKGDTVSGGCLLGTVAETGVVEHRILVPPGVEGRLERIAPAGGYTLAETVAVVGTAAGPRELTMMQRWPVRVPRPIRERRAIDTPLVTGQRIIDTLFPIGKGGTAAIPGGFGTGKTITQHQLAKWSDADIIVYIGCGERGNEMTEVLREFPEIKDPRSGRPLMERTILIANTSNMPVAAREVSIYTGITLAEYYRDQGRSVAVFADSTSRWAEALRELAARLEEMPAEEGFPATLPTRLAQFYERAGSVVTLDGARGAISIVGAVSPPGGDFSEPVTQHTQRFIRCFWALDTELANARHYPSINWLRSYSEYTADVESWWRRQAPDWAGLRSEAIGVLQREERLQQIVKLVGPDVLPDSQRLVLFVAELLKDGFLTQNAFDEKDMYCSPARQMLLLRIIMGLYLKGREMIEKGTPLLKLRQLPCVPRIVRAKADFGNDEMDALAQFEATLAREMAELAHGRDGHGGQG